MSTYIIGDIHGCLHEFQALLELIRFKPQQDQLILIGDLIGRGPYSKNVLELLMDLGKAVIPILGNHDLKFLAIAYGIISPSSAQEWQALLESPNLEFYIAWLTQAKLLYVDYDAHFVAVHAAIPPHWDVPFTAQKYAQNYENYKNTNGMKKTLEVLFPPPLTTWQGDMSLEDTIRYTVFGFTQLKYCYRDGRFDTTYQKAPGLHPPELIPWFSLRDPLKNHNFHIFFGHWAALGFYQDRDVTCCDTGCVWGGKLTAIKIDLPIKVYQVPSSYSHDINLKEGLSKKNE